MALICYTSSDRAPRMIELLPAIILAVAAVGLAAWVAYDEYRWNRRRHK